MYNCLVLKKNKKKTFNLITNNKYVQYVNFDIVVIEILKHPSLKETLMIILRFAIRSGKTL